MTRFVIHRLLALIPLVIGVSFLVFLMLQLVPGDPVMMMLGEFSMATAKDVEALRQQLGFNDPLYIQYWNYFKNLITGDLGTSIKTAYYIYIYYFVFYDNLVSGLYII